MIAGCSAAAAMGEEKKKKVSISIIGKRRPHKLPSIFAAIDDARSSVPASAAAPARQFVVEFDPSQAPAPVTAPFVIAPLPNSGIFGLRKPSPLLAAPSAAGLPAFVLDTSTAANDASSGTHYGLITRRDAVDDAPDRGMEEFRDMPVEGFGAAILAGYGLTVTKEENTMPKAADRGAKHGLGYNPSEAYNYKRSSSKRSRTEACEKDYCDARHKRHGEKRSRTDARDNSRDRGRESKARWLQSHIRVRVVSEKLGRRLFLTKGKVVDLVSPTACDVVMDDGSELVQGVEQVMLETVLPRTNGTVLVLYGKQKGMCGRLVEKNADEEVGLVEDVDAKGVMRVRYDQMAEFTGDM